MKIKKTIFFGFLLFSVLSVPLLEANPHGAADLRSLTEIFPDLSFREVREVFSPGGLRNTFLRDEIPLIRPAADSGVDLLGQAMTKQPSQLVEALIVIPYTGRLLTKLDAYNVIGRIRDISNYQVFFDSQEAYVTIFEESTRLQDGRRNRPIPDPPPATVLPSSEIMYVLLRDTFFGNTYFRGTLHTGSRGITYYLTNNSAVWFLIFPVMRAERFTALLYVEPVREGMLIYGVSGITVPDFIASRVNLAANIDRRITVFINWLSDGFRSIR